MISTLFSKRPAWLLAVLALCLAAALGPVAHAADPTPERPADIDKTLDAARTEMEALRKGLNEVTDDNELQRRRAAALDLQAKAQAAADRLGPILDSVKLRLTQLGPVAAGSKEAPDVAAQRAQLEKASGTLDSEIKLAKLLAVEGGQTAEQVSNQRRARFQARLGERHASVLGMPFWREFHDDFPGDRSRVKALAGEFATAVEANAGWTWGALLLALAIIGGLAVAINRGLLQLTATRVPAGRLRRSFHALIIVLLCMLAPGLSAELVYTALTWSQQLADDTQTLLAGLVGMAFFGGFVTGLGIALLEPDRPSWRLMDIPDENARALRWFPLVLGPLTILAWLVERLPILLNASLSTTMLVNCAVTLVLGGVLASALLHLEWLRRRRAHEDKEEKPPRRPLWIGAIVALVWVALATALLATLVGYVAFGNFIAKELVWTLIVLCAAWLLCVLIDDFFMTVVGSRGEDGSGEPRIRDQAAVLLSGVGRVGIVLLGLVLLLGQFGEGPMELLQRADQVRQGLVVGEVHLQPASLLQGVLVLALALLGVRLFKRWLTTRYLPTTTLDPGMQLSAATLFGYAGVVVAISLALSAIGIGLERVAWVASALSVGIGFGLQAVVQNFVSGLILLAERPVKVGDWVSLGGVEGDIRRINVRATEIQMSDRSTMIVPNSEFITKTVRNVTHANPLGLVQVKLPVPLTMDADQVSDIMLASFKEHEDIADTPEPNVFLDGIDGTNLIFNATGYVSSPRAAYRTRSALLFEILRRLNGAGLKLAKPPTLLVRAPAAESPLPMAGAADDDAAPATITRAAADDGGKDPGKDAAQDAGKES
jgi:small-conductance mechanosensitive channel